MSSHGISRLYSIGLILLAFGAVHRPAGGGYLTASPGIPLLLLATILGLLSMQGRQGRQSPSQYGDFHLARLAIRLWWIGLAMSLVSVGLFGISELFAAKAASLSVLTLVWLSPLLCAPLLRTRHLVIASHAGLAICICALIFSDFLKILPTTMQEIIFSENYLAPMDPRPRGFMEEPSHFSSLTSSFAFMAFMLSERGRRYSMKRLLVFTVALAALLLVLGSKGAIGGVALAMLTIAVRWRQLPYLVLLVPGAWFLVESQMSALVMDFEEFTSAATRLGLAVTALIGLAHDPFGYGYYGFYGAVQKYGVVAMNWLTSIVPVNISELQTIVEDLVAVSTKSTLLDFCLTLGGFFVLFLWQMVRLIDLWDPRARVCMAYFLLLALTNSGHASITFFLGWLVMIRGFPRREAFVRSRRRSRWARWLQHLLGQGRSRPADLVPVPTGRDA